jgi:hypothetical protein
MTITEILALTIIAAALLPAGREMLDNLARELSSTERQAVLKTDQPERIGSADDKAQALETESMVMQPAPGISQTGSR